MSDYDNIKIRRLDLSILLIFLGLLRTGKASMVAAELGLTNSSISHALQRLRSVFNDDLFLRRPHGLEPTAYALKIESDIKRAVDAIQSVLHDTIDFQPEMAKAILNIAASDRAITSLIPDSLAQIAKEAPGIRFSFQSLSSADSLRGLADGSLDLAIGYFQDPGAEFDQIHLQSETYLVVGRKDHPIWQTDLTLRAYCDAMHILVSSDGSLTGIVDVTLQNIGETRRVIHAIPAFMPALSILSRTDFIATLPAGLVRQYASVFDLKFHAPPIDIRPFTISMLIHKRNRKSPLHKWCIDCFRVDEMEVGST